MQQGRISCWGQRPSFAWYGGVAEQVGWPSEGPAASLESVLGWLAAEAKYIACVIMLYPLAGRWLESAPEQQ